MKPDYEYDGAQLYCGDCLDVLPTLEDNSVDLTVTSPPYDDIRTYNSVDKYDAGLWKPLIENLYRVTKNNGVVVWVVGDQTKKGSETGTSFRQALWAMECGFRLHDTMIYRKASTPFPDSNRYQQCFEYMFVWAKGRPGVVNLIADRKNKSAGKEITGTSRQSDGSLRRITGDIKFIKEYGVRTNVWDLIAVGGQKTGHPAVFPRGLARDHILSWSNAGSIVLDPMVGSGTTGIACAKTGRRFIGIEKDRAYFDLAVKRISGAIKRRADCDMEVLVLED